MTLGGILLTGETIDFVLEFGELASWGWGSLEMFEEGITEGVITDT